MADQSDIQTPIFSSYEGLNKLAYYHYPGFCLEFEDTPEVRSDLRVFAESALELFHKYDIPWLKCELLGHHLDNLNDFLEVILELSLDASCEPSRLEDFLKDDVFLIFNRGEKPPSAEPTSNAYKWFDQIPKDIKKKRIHCEITCFPQLRFLKHVTNTYFEEIT